MGPEWAPTVFKSYLSSSTWGTACESSLQSRPKFEKQAFLWFIACETTETSYGEREVAFDWLVRRMLITMITVIQI